MKKHLKLFFTSLSLVLLVGLIGSLFFIFQPNLYKSQILTTLNQEFALERGSQIFIESISGNLLKGFSLNGLSFSDSAKSYEIYSENLRLSYSIKNLLMGDFELHELNLNKPYIYLNLNKKIISETKPDSSGKRDRVFELSSMNIVDGTIEIVEGKFKYLINNLNISGSFLLEGKDMTIGVRKGEFYYPSRDLYLEALSGKISHTENGWSFESLQFTALDCDVFATGWMETTDNFQMGFDMAADINSFGKIFKFLGQNARLEGKVSIVGNVGGSLSDLGFNFSAYGEAGGRKFNELNLSGGYTGDLLELVNIDGNIAGTSLEGRASVTREGNFDVSIKVRDLDLHELSLSDFPTDINGAIRFRGKGYTKEKLVMEGEIEVTSSEINNLQIESALGVFNIKNEKLVVDSVTVKMKESSLVATGTFGFDGSVNSAVKAESNNLNEFTSLFNVREINGNTSANLTLSGNLRDLNVAGNFEINDLVGSRGNFESAKGIFVLNNISSRQQGNGYFHLVNGKIGKLKIESVDLSTILEDGKLTIQNFSAENGKDYVKFIGWINEDGQFEIDSLTGEFRNYKISSNDVLRGSREGNVFSIRPVSLNLIGGSIDISAEWNKQTDSLTSTFLLKSVDLAPISDLIDYNTSFGGKVSGALILSNTLSKPNLKAVININEASHGNYALKEISTNLFYENGLLIIDKLHILEKENSWVNLNGSVELTLSNLNKRESVLTPENEIELFIGLNNVNLFTYKKFNPFKQEIGGIASGSINISKTFSDPEMSFDLDITNGWFDKILFDRIQTIASYADTLLQFESIAATVEKGEYTGSGYLPFNMALWKVEGRKLDREMLLNVKGESRDIQFFTVYFADIDDIQGDFEIELNLSGKFHNPIRDGYIRMKNGRIDSNLLQNSATEIEGELVVVENMGRIELLTGMMKGGKKKGLLDKVLDKFSGFSDIFAKDDNVNPRHFTMSGEVDITSFFRPIFNMTFKGEQLYVLSILGELESVTDVDLKITGQDTIVITGELLPDFVTIRSEFVEELEEEIIVETVPYFDYNIHAVMTDKFYLKNSQADIEFSADIWIIKIPQEEYNFSGSISSIKGKFFYINDTFVIERADIEFDPYEFNPRFDILATTSIGIGDDPIEIIVEMGGTLEKPTFIFSDANGDFSESDILALINFKQTGSNLTATGITKGVQYMAESYLEKSFEDLGSELAGLDIFDLQTESGTFQDIKNVELLVGRQISRSFYVTYQRGLQRLAASQKVGVEYKINQNSSLTGNVDTAEGLLNVSYKLRLQY